jgi:hypothetical protein
MKFPIRLLVVAASVLALACAKAQQNRPNVLFIFVDDSGLRGFLVLRKSGEGCAGKSHHAKH